jgi:SOS-response transcriptional repressor LexA
MRVQLIAEKMRAIIEKRGVTAKQAADEIGINQSVVGRIVNKKQGWVQPDVAQKISEWLRRNGQKMPVTNVTLLPSKFRVVRVYGLAHAAMMSNLPCDIVPDVHDTELPTIIYLTNTTHRLAAFKVDGDSMLPVLRAGMNVVCDCDVPATEIHNGNIVVAKFNNKAVLKRFQRVDDTIILTSESPAGEAFTVHASEMQWMLRAIGVVGDL